MVARLTFWVFVVLLGLDLGAGLYETRVLLPYWAPAIEAGTQATDKAVAVGRSAGPAWWVMVTPTLGLFALLALVTGLGTAQPHRTWRLAATILEVATVATTLTFFAPNIIALLGANGTPPPAGAAARFQMWTMLNWGRCAVTTVAWLSALRALSLPM